MAPSAAPELVVLCGLQASGKTTFYRRHFAATHEHVSKDLMPHNRRKDARQRELLAGALRHGRSVVVDNTNPTPADRVPLIAIARAYGATVTGYVFITAVQQAIERNDTRVGRKVPVRGILATANRFSAPTPAEGYSRLFTVRLADNDFIIEQACPNGRPATGFPSDQAGMGIGRAINRKVRPMTEHKGEEFKGRAKEAAGDLTGDKDLKREGKVDKGSAKTKDKVGDAADKVKDAVNPKR